MNFASLRALPGTWVLSVSQALLLFAAVDTLWVGLRGGYLLPSVVVLIVALVGVPMGALFGLALALARR